jgi:hypothetical protein
MECVAAFAIAQEVSKIEIRGDHVIVGELAGYGV